MNNLDKEMKKHKFIVFSQDHYNPLNVIRSLGEKGLEPISILYTPNPVLINHCRYVSRLHQVESLEEGFRLLINLYGGEQFKPFVFCSDDTTQAFLDSHFEDIRDKFFLYNATKSNRIVWLQDKYNILSLAERVGLDVPKSEVVETGILPQNLNYPIITKVLASTMGRWKGDVYICQNEEELKKAYIKIKSPQLILQEYIYKKGEFCMEGFSINDGKDIFIPYIIDYLRYYHNSYGHYMNISPFIDEELNNKIKALFRETRYNGIFEIEFMKGPDQKSYFLEINFRASTWNYALTVGGCNLPYFWAKSTLFGRIPYEEMILKEMSFNAMVEPDDFLTNVLVLKNVGPLKWVKDLRRCECLYYYNKKDKKPIFYFLLRLIKSKIKRIL